MKELKILANFEAIELDEGYIIKEVRSCGYFSGLLFDGKPLEPLKKYGWYRVDGIPKNVTYTKNTYKNERFVLKNPDMESETIPATLPLDVATYDMDEGRYWFMNKYEHLESLYKVEQSCSEETIQVEWECTRIIEAHGFIERFGQLIPVGSEWEEKIDGIIPRSKIIHNEVTKQLIPEPLVEFTPGKISSQDMFDLVRNYVLQNLDRNVCSVSTNYDFHFIVKKKIVLSQPVHWTKEEKRKDGKSYAKRRFKSGIKSIRELVVLDIAPNKKQGSTSTCKVLPPLYGNTADEVSKKAEGFLLDLVEYLNTPYVECEHCNGLGIKTQDFDFEFHIEMYNKLSLEQEK